jgi:hypothetical protein
MVLQEIAITKVTTKRNFWYASEFAVPEDRDRKGEPCHFEV